jgi:site-specific recombinase XerD
MINTGTVKVLDKLVCIGALAPYIDGFTALCAREGHSTGTLRRKYSFLANLSRWLKRRKLPLAKLDETQLNYFHAKHPERAPSGDLSTGRQLLEFLRSLGAIPAVPGDRTPLGEFIRDYERFLISERGLSQVTVIDHLRIVRSFLTGRFGDKALRFQILRPRDIHRFILGEAQRVSRSRAQQAAGTLRPLLRFLRQRGFIESDLAAAIPRVASWRLSRLPKFLPPEQIKRLLKCCDRSTPVGQRDYAILLFLARLGLRSGEVAAMTLDDFDWERSEFIVHGKGPRHERLPLPKDVGTALLHYLRYARPACSARHVFVRMRAPFRAFADPNAVYQVVRTALKRAGLNPHLKGGHLFRHASACHLLRAGVDINTIRAWLGHVSLSTTNVYAEVDLEMKAKALARTDLGNKVTMAKRWRKEPGLIGFLKGI